MDKRDRDFLLALFGYDLRVKNFRIDIDDPLHGYMVRSVREGWLQGFITWTTFTTWHRDFEWNSLIREAGVIFCEAGFLTLPSHFDFWPGAGISDEDKRIHTWDYDNSLAKELQSQERSGNPDDEGIAWNRPAATPSPAPVAAIPLPLPPQPTLPAAA